MEYKFHLETIIDKFKFNSSIRHNPKIPVEILPYNTKFKEVQFNLKEVVSEFLRLVGQKKISSETNPEQLIETVLKSIEFKDINQKNEFKQMIKTLFIDENNQLFLFHPQTLYYINTVENENRKLAEFLYAVLWNGRAAWEINKDEHQTDDLMSSLIFKALPELKSEESQSQKFSALIPEISELFAIDFEWLSTKQDLFTQQFEKLLSYYYFFYVTQLSRRNEALFATYEKSVVPIYFTFEEEEKLSKTRVSYEYGWKNIERSINRMFTHVNFLKMLNISVEETGELLSYHEIAEMLRSGTYEEISRIEEAIDKVIEQYGEGLSDVKWNQMNLNPANYDLTVLNKLSTLFQMIDYQFNNSFRSKPYNEYKMWFTHFCQRTFLKSRGRSGKMLILDTDYLLFLTKVIIKDEPKIRLKKLFEHFEVRGIIYDRDTQGSIIEYFEKLNLLEKKSDSGDAIYVKAFL
ncbi:DNA phosphorothioation-dependent restriction protein DptG [Paenibacillus marchantiae]|uniref:DNA phosphorothioation-dependent restriction protein DptG n=1 Tax=Paenibacillus marchantiae TaxID=3026433 RepID=UPI00237A2072|nr:DNA phosphorothioation-dependent restriction protein DptG [Paenibacillus marchantiae]WDQ34547.1 DNA phosphorothioation-dependent restriction protein DptG [Paenibacillus marchantiae]